jgi:predicted short-subunit dehydrogenase-like oxidoreductase (DUF2520 family)
VRSPWRRNEQPERGDAARPGERRAANGDGTRAGAAGTGAAQADTDDTVPKAAATVPVSAGFAPAGPDGGAPGAAAQSRAGQGTPAGSDADRDPASGPGPIQSGLPRIGFVGAGRVGTALGIALRRAGWPVTAVASRDPARRDAFVALVAGAKGFGASQAVVDESDLLFVTVPDDAIADVATGIRLYSGQAIVHTSGALPAAALAPAMAAGTEAGSFHPLVAFADLEAALAALPGATVAIEGDEGLLPLLSDLAVATGARPVRVTAAGKAAHHAAAVMAAGGLVVVLDAVAELGASAGLVADDRLGSYLGLAGQALENARRLGTVASLTGPIVRGDLGTVRLHLDALRRLAPDVVPIYVALSRRAVAIAQARGDLGPERTAELLALLASDR